MALSLSHGSNRKKLRYAAPYHVHLNGAGSNGCIGPSYLLTSVASGPQNLLHHDIVLGHGRATSSIATTCHHHNYDYANA
jgi:hypothetical protein